MSKRHFVAGIAVTLGVQRLLKSEAVNKGAEKAADAMAEYLRAKISYAMNVGLERLFFGEKPKPKEYPSSTDEVDPELLKVVVERSGLTKEACETLLADNWIYVEAETGRPHRWIHASVDELGTTTDTI